MCVYRVEVSKILLHPICCFGPGDFWYSEDVIDSTRNPLQVDPAPVFDLYIAVLEAAPSPGRLVAATAASWISTRSS